ncbi:SLC13 family permease [Aureibacter tunicatorum]|uniref:Sodium-dependent dicarboxylate transporter 2/3/5 n=1 Tax=Aureibacter tunicatorum TaxID=866807 RepID=A0AAE3XN97_9BACT|nr:DASS family sodium-coupled anion symporter [Aureibacter tunicatorum]MDR6239630.1 sodium-dependent dicarboxylate transporter 2/3/5 [Aureibacter tunicatorum]BDD04106.1 SLC13 family permease [Aureibacter tunicatorum]
MNSKKSSSADQMDSVDKFKLYGIFLGPIMFTVLLLIPFGEGMNPQAQKVLAIASWMLIWWITEAVPLAVGALLPIPLLSLMGVSTVKEATLPYSSPIVFLFLGGFILAVAMEKWKFHLRVALGIIKLTGTHANGIVAGFMIATALLSMWISNTATTVMMLPIAVSVITLLNNQIEDMKKLKNFSLAILLGIAYAANIGGIATLIGTPANTIFAGYLKETHNIDLDFARWMLVGLPFSIILLGICYFMLIKVFFPNNLGKFGDAKELFDSESKKLGKITYEEKSVFVVFLITATLWLTRSLINKILVNIVTRDEVIALVGAITLFVLPTSKKDGSRIMEWDDAQKLPWGILLLFGGGLSMASALTKTGLIEIAADYVTTNVQVSALVIIIILTTMMIFMTEMMSNVALATLFIPVAGGIATQIGADFLQVTVPVAIAASCAFMLPMATPPNAIVFASGEIKVSQMARTGFLLNIISILLLTLFSLTFVKWVF